MGNWKTFGNRVDEKVLFRPNHGPERRGSGQVEGVFEGPQTASFILVVGIRGAPSPRETVWWSYIEGWGVRGVACAARGKAAEGRLVGV